ncbi:Uncharacterised protein [Chryseobacterium taihuense]|uniref:Uncharacterized protein n=1 Tax=Chryseobacterium taihuense TaxID=1141221 RepID=A0A4U8WFC3_9FLAO|nr:Uncharacterised protein [Chryseobacterium taihuense]
MALADHPIYPQFSKKLVVTSFNTPDMKGDEERICQCPPISDP